ncbi:PTH2-domain-containing protein [Neoconidiobolus thromboides FSU 785]|nr:PTH2-domain-containing protein [Neoconidiobolus thromboides FSU 785]
MHQIVTLISGLLLGYTLHSVINSSKATSSKKQRKQKQSEETETETETDSEAEFELNEEDSSESCKMVLVVRTDLGMGKGKVAAQCSHATLACYKKAVKLGSKSLKIWEYQGQPKITLKCDSEEQMLLLFDKASKSGLICQVIRDAGRTQIAAGSLTVLGIGPSPISQIDQVTGHLKLY